MSFSKSAEGETCQEVFADITDCSDSGFYGLSTQVCVSLRLCAETKIQTTEELAVPFIMYD